jgi:hypothetical protein
MSITKLDKALGLLRQPDAKLVRLHSNSSAAGYFIWPDGGRISDELAQLLLERGDVQPHDSGLLPGHPQSWRLGNWRARVDALRDFAELERIERYGTEQ